MFESKEYPWLSFYNWPRLIRYSILKFIANHVVFYPTPSAINYAWSFGSLAGLSLVIQVFTGVLLSMHYTADINLAFTSIIYIMRDVNHGWLLRYTHSNGASMFFIVIYAHIVRGLYYGSYMSPRQFVWCSGVVLFILMMATAFTGYVLPWGQMSFWGVTVISNMFTVLPLIGQTVVNWFWGGYTVNNPTLHRIYSIHYVLPFLMIALTFLHLTLLHKVGSGDALGSDAGVADIPFYPSFFDKDAQAVAVYLIVFGTYVLFFPNVLNHPDNYIPANAYETPAHVVPEWYFLAFYAMLRSIPYKTLGVSTMVCSILVLFSIPFTYYAPWRNTEFRPVFKPFFWLFISNFIILSWLGQQNVSNYIELAGQVCTMYYFLFFVIAVPLVGRFEEALLHYETPEREVVRFNIKIEKLYDDINGR